MSLFSEQGENQSRSYRGGSLASRTALRESVKHLVTNVICGLKCGVLLAKLSPDGLWERMYQDFYQVNMDGSLEEFSGTFPRWGMMLDGELLALPELEPSIDESEWRLLPTPTASDYRLGRTPKAAKAVGRTENNNYRDFCRQVLGQMYPEATQTEKIMGFPTGWTELNALETQ